MHNFRQLPPLLRFVGIAGLVLPLAALALLLQMLPTKLATSDWPTEFTRVVAIALSLILLSGACSFVVTMYSMRFRRSAMGLFPLASWQSQVRTLLLLAALPMGALALAVVIPSTYLVETVFFPLSASAALMLIAAYVYASIRWHALD